MNTADPIVVEWHRYMTANALAHDDYVSRLTGCWPCRRCQREFRHPLPRARHEHSCRNTSTGVNGRQAFLPDGTSAVPDDPKALTPPAPAGLYADT